ncbi:MAG: hypothetical protein QGH51_07995 [Planctomycetota bacterium]|jgi:tetratricopeptide (TPR) repeat protein|nr:hypothetical protein [Planctomycetota bacterium]MDP6941948.1 hypothetical protein [Planctomycetota bacterium]
MDLKKHLDRAEQALHRGQADFSAELCDQVLDFAPGEARAAELLAKSLVQMGVKKSLLGKLGAGPAGLAAGLSKITKNPDAEARARRRAFLKDPGDISKGCAWAEALERAGYAGAALGAYGALSESDVTAAKQAGALAHAQGEVDLALEYYQRALDVDPRDTDALRARKNLAAEQALRTNRYDEADSALDLLVDMDKPAEDEG